MRREAPRFPQEFDPSSLVRLPTASTTGGTLPDGRIVDLIRDPKSASLRFIYLEGSQYRTADRLELKNQTLVPAGLDPAVQQAMVLPTGAMDFGSVAKLFVELRAPFTIYGFSEKLATAASYYALASWFPEVWDPPPCLLITGEATEASRLLRILGLLVRHGLAMSDIGSVGFRTMLAAFRATVLADARYLSKNHLNVLASCNPLAVHPCKNSIVKSTFAKVIYVDEKTSEKFRPDFALQVSVSPAPCGVPLLSEANAQQLSATLQSKLLGYRLCNLSRVVESGFDVPQMGTESRTIARLLGRCIVGAPELEYAVRLLLEARENHLQDDRWTDPDCVVIEALLASCHQPGTDRVHIGKIADDASTILGARGEPATLKPRRAGSILRTLGFVAKRDTNGRYLPLIEKVIERVHRLARDHGVAAIADGHKSKSCLFCKRLFAEAPNPL